MELVIDANILIASFLKSATTRSLILDTRLKLYSPEHILIEGREVLRGRLAKRIKDLSDLDFDQLFTLLTERIVILPKEDYYDHLGKALEIAPHEEDAPYLACALHLGIPLWSNDGGMKAQTFVKVLSTTEVLESLTKK